MTAIQLLACAGMIVGVFLLLGMKPVEFTDSLFGFLLNPKRSLREDIRESSGRKKSGISYGRRIIQTVQWGYKVWRMISSGSHAHRSH